MQRGLVGVNGGCCRAGCCRRVQHGFYLRSRDKRSRRIVDHEPACAGCRDQSRERIAPICARRNRNGARAESALPFGDRGNRNSDDDFAASPSGNGNGALEQRAAAEFERTFRAEAQPGSVSAAEDQRGDVSRGRREDDIGWDKRWDTWCGRRSCA
jgi:hypothetical protein